MNAIKRGASQLRIAAWSLLAACIVFFILAWTTNAPGWWAFCFYASLITGLILMYVDYRNLKKPTSPVSQAPEPSLPAKPTAYNQALGTGQSVEEIGKAKPETKLSPQSPRAKPTVLTPAPNFEQSGPVPFPTTKSTPAKKREKPVAPPIPSASVKIPANLVNGRYEIVAKEYKKGGMSVISLAKDYRNNQQVKVVIKTARHDSEHSIQLNIEKLRQEAEYLRSVDHPNIVKFIDLFSDRNNSPNLVVEYIEGDDLLTRFKVRPADEHRAVKWGIQILNAMEYIHSSGVVHRDLNPGNIMVNASDDVILIDFGTIKGSGYSSDTVFFKPGFNIPEVSARSYADERSDIYGIGSILFYLLTCERPGFIRDRDVVSLLEEKGVSHRTAKCVAQALQLDPNFRFQTAAAMRRALTGE